MLNKTLALVGLSVLTLSANATLYDRGGGFIYDDVLNITWTQDANINGLDTWDNQMAWADSLSLYDSVRDVTWNDWRLASMDVNGDNMIINCSSATETECRDNEYGYLFEQYGVSSIAPDLFLNVQHYYWSGTEYQANSSGAHTYIKDGVLSLNNTGIKSFDWYAWAVRDGDVAAVPVPAAVWLFGSALIGLAGIKRKK